MYGIVKIPSRFDVTVRAKANAVLAPASWVRETPLVRVVGTQQKIANPVTSSLGTKFRRKTGTAIKGVMNKIETRPKRTAGQALAAFATSPVLSVSPEITKMADVVHLETPHCCMS